MSNFRLNARKPKNNAGLPTPKGELYLLYKEDIISLPETTDKGVLCIGDIHLKPGRRFHILYLTPNTQKRNSKTDGDVDSRGFKKKVVGNYPGDEIEIHEFIKNNVNQGFVIIMNSYDKVYHRIYGSKDNPLYFTGDFNDDDSSKGWELTFEQNFADGDPVLFYNGEIIIDENALGGEDIEFEELYARRDATNLSDANKEKWLEWLAPHFQISLKFVELEVTLTSNMISGQVISIDLLDELNTNLERSVFYNGVFIPKSMTSIVNNQFKINLSSQNITPLPGQNIVLKYYKK